MTDWVREEARRQLVACNCLTDSVDRQLAESCLRAGLREGTHCCWTPDDDAGAYNTACGNKYLLIEGTPAENGMRFCCYCGGALKP